MSAAAVAEGPDREKVGVVKRRATMASGNAVICTVGLTRRYIYPNEAGELPTIGSKVRCGRTADGSWTWFGYVD